MFILSEVLSGCVMKHCKPVRELYVRFDPIFLVKATKNQSFLLLIEMQQ